jgi:hypothetical protein
MYKFAVFHVGYSKIIQLSIRTFHRIHSVSDTSTYNPWAHTDVRNYMERSEE